MKRSAVALAVLSVCAATAKAATVAPLPVLPAPAAEHVVPLSHTEITFLQTREASSQALLNRSGAGCVLAPFGHHGKIIQNCSTPASAFGMGCVPGLLLGGLVGSFWGLTWVAIDAGGGCLLTGAWNYSYVHSAHRADPDWQ